ncbi:MAG TPA: DEAD/DEAH box helicase, partial [Anaerolineae bacterium]
MPAESVIANVAPLTDAVAGVLSYLVPEDLKDKVSEGVVVIVPLRSRLVAGVVMSVHPAEEHTGTALPVKPYTLKPLHTVLDEQPALNKTQLALARWMAHEYCAPLGRCCGLMVPPGFTPSTAYLYTLAKEDQPMQAPGSTHDARSQIIDVLHRHGSLVESKLKVALKGVKRWRSALRGLVQAGVVVRTSTLEPPVGRPRRTTMAQLVLSDATLEIVLVNLAQEATKTPRRANALNRRMAVLTYLQQHNRMIWADWVFAETGATRADLDWLAERNYILLGDAERWRDPLADIDYVVNSAPPLTTDQARAWDAVRAAMQTEDAAPTADDGAPIRRGSANKLQFLVRGVTGSGKTEVYMRAVDLALQRGCGALVLVPEISLTPQTARRFLSRFPGQVALIHSRLKPGERFDTWRRIRAGELKVVVGARSALFAPLPEVGVIVLDEEHDQSYKQSSPPYYDTRRVAMHYAQDCGATLLLGSATPSLEAWQLAQEGTLKVLELPNRVRGHIKRVTDQQARLGVKAVALRETDTVVYQPMPDVQVVDMRAELRGGNLSMFSGTLSLALSETLQRGEQAILFLNRRGSASCVICRQCGYVLRCPNDDVPLTYHQISG